MLREPGFYWCSVCGFLCVAEWYWSDKFREGYWLVPGCDQEFDDKLVKPLSERIEKPK